MKSEKYDEKYKNETKANWNDRDHFRNETVPNPTLNKLEKQAMEAGKGNPVGNNGDGDNRKVFASLKSTKIDDVRVQIQDIKSAFKQEKIGNYFSSNDQKSLKDDKSKQAETKKWNI